MVPLSDGNAERGICLDRDQSQIDFLVARTLRGGSGLATMKL